MKNYFELNIREKHVRNLCCPICQHPNMDNTEAANEYLAFLTMLVSGRLLLSSLPKYMQIMTIFLCYFSSIKQILIRIPCYFYSWIQWLVPTSVKSMKPNWEIGTYKKTLTLDGVPM